MRFNGLNLNLLVALDALLAERNVSLAADRICLSQSATSSALARLRDYFEDDLLVVKGRQMVLTPRGTSLVEPVRSVLDQIRSQISISPSFDPATTDRELRLMVSDYTMQVFLIEAIADISHAAPLLRFMFLPPHDNPVESLRRGDVDLLFSRDHALSGSNPQCQLFTDDHVVLGWRGNPYLQQPLSVENFHTLGHVTAEFGLAKRSSANVANPAHPTHPLHKCRIEASVPSFLAAPPLLVGSNRIALVPRRLARRLAAQWPLVSLEAPIELPSFREAMQWHQASASDQAIQWLITVLQSAAEALDESSGAPNIVQFSRGSTPAKTANA